MIGQTNSVIDNTEPKTMINVTTPLTELFGKEVTCTDGTSTFTSTFSDTGECSFIVNNIGTYTITCEDLNYTIEVTEIGTVYSVVFEYSQLVNYTMLYYEGDECEELTGGWDFSNTLTIPSTANAASGYGSDISTDKYLGLSMTTVSTAKLWYICGIGTNKSIDLTEYCKMLVKYDFPIIETVVGGTYGYHGINISTEKMAYEVLYKDTNSAIYNGALKSTDISGVEGERYLAMILSHVRHHSGNIQYMVHSVAIFKADDWSTLCSKAGITVPATLDELIADTEALTTIFNNEDIVKYMISNCTGDFMAAVIQNKTALQIIRDSQYNSTIYGNEHWNKFLSMAGEVAEKDKVYLYNEGDECTDITGGWDKIAVYDSIVANRPNKNQYLTLTKNSDNMIASSTNLPGQSIVAIGCMNQIDLSKYSKLRCVLNDATTSDSITHCDLMVSSSLEWSEHSGWYRFMNTGELVSSEFELDISEISDTLSIYITVTRTSSTTTGNFSINISKIWLEK